MGLEPVHGVGVVAVEVGDPFLQLLAEGAFLDAEVEELDVSVQRELVHGVQAAHVVENEKEEGSSVCTRSIGL